MDAYIKSLLLRDPKLRNMNHFSPSSPTSDVVCDIKHATGIFNDPICAIVNEYMRTTKDKYVIQILELCTVITIVHLTSNISPDLQFHKCLQIYRTATAHACNHKIHSISCDFTQTASSCHGHSNHLHF